MSTDQRAFILVGLGFGDEGKGSIADFLTREYAAHTVVRYNGGAQAAHNVIAPDGRHHTFAQFGSGTLVPGVRTHLSRFMLVNPLNLFTEERHLQELGVTDALQRLSVEGLAPITTPFQVAMNRLRELARGKGRHGSCGLGIGETMADLLAHGDAMPRAADLAHPAQLQDKLRFVQQQKAAEAALLQDQLPAGTEAAQQWQILHDPEAVELCLGHYQDFADLVEVVDSTYLGQLLALPGTVIFEGAQGVLLDEWRGFHPYTTWSTTTTANADALLAEANYTGQSTRIGLVRAYASRHGAGPFVTEEEWLTQAIPDLHNSLNPWQREFRVGVFDDVATRYALEVTGGVDYLAVSHLDKLSHIHGKRRCDGYWTSNPAEAEELAERDAAGRIIRLKPGPFTDLDYQSRLTELLQECQPAYTRSNHDYGLRATYRFLSELEQAMGVPIGITSAGPAAQDKMLEAMLPLAA